MLSRRASQDRSTRQPPAWIADGTNVTTNRMEAALNKASGRASQYERQLNALESQLTVHLSNYRAIDNRLREALTHVRRNEKRCDRALDSHIPHIMGELDKSIENLSVLAEILPTTHSQVRNIRRVYDSGLSKAEALVSDLNWLNTSFYERWRAIVFTSSSPVSWRWKVLMRIFFTISLVVCAWMAWITLRGAYRAHRERLIWGQRLMS